jgi:hypothetical protein
MMPLGEPPPAYLPPPAGRPEYNPERHRAWRMGCLTAVVVLLGFPALVTAVVYRSPIAFVWGFLFVFFLIATLVIFASRRG